MNYKDYHIIAEVNVNSQWDFEELANGSINLTEHISDGEADEDNLADFLVERPDGEHLDWADTLEDAKKLIDEDIERGN